MEAMPKISVIGIGYRRFDRTTADIMKRADHILASARLFEVFKGYEEFPAVADRVVVIPRMDETIEFIRANKETKNIVLLASGDPLFFGIGKRIIDEFGRERVDIYPDLSSVQAAFARIKEPWDNVFFMSLHGGPDPEQRRRLEFDLADIPSLLTRHPKIAILTDREKNPSLIATAIAGHEPPGSGLRARIFVCERLGYPDEQVTEGTPEEIRKMTFSDPNVVIVMR